MAWASGTAHPVGPWVQHELASLRGCPEAAGSYHHSCLLDAHSDGAPEGLGQRFCLAHLQGEDLTACDGCEWGVRAQGLCHA